MKKVAVLIGVFAVVLMVLLLIGTVPHKKEQPVPAAGSTVGLSLNTAAIPDPKLVPWIQAAGSLCPEVPAPLVAAQIEAESSWKKNAVSPMNAQGIAQFLPATFAAIGKDENHNGITSPLDPADAIMAQGRYDCQIAGQVGKIKASKVDVIDLILAGYNAGPAAVVSAGGIPNITETQSYVTKISALISKYTAPTSASGSSAGGQGGNCRQPLLIKSVIGTGLGVSGPAWHWYGKHTGVDYLAPMGAKIVAACDGKIALQSGGSYGNHIIEDLGQINGHHYQILYAHMSAFASVKNGQSVKAGQVIGFVGQTGNAFGPHLHAEVRRDFEGTKPPFDRFESLPTFIKQHSGPVAPTDAADGGNETAGDSTIAAVIKAAKSQLGVPYAWAGGTLTGPSKGVAQGANTVGWDCSSLVRYAWYQGTNGKITLGRLTYDQTDDPNVKTIARKDIQPGDLIFFQTESQGAGWSHVGLYIGNGEMIEAPRTGSQVKITSITSGYYASQPQTVRRVKID